MVQDVRLGTTLTMPQLLASDSSWAGEEEREVFS